MSDFYSPQILQKTVALIKQQFHVPDKYAKRLATSALSGIESHGGDPNDFETVKETVRVVVTSWVKDGAFKQLHL